MKMDYGEFVNTVVEELTRRIGDSCKIYCKPYLKNNGTRCLAVCISDSRYKVYPCYCMESFYELYQKPSDIGLIAQDIIKTYQKEAMDSFSAGWLLERSRILYQVVFRVASTEKNSVLMKHVPHHDMPELGLSMLFYLIVDTEDSHQATMLLSNRHLKMCSISDSELLECAQKNTPLVMEYQISSIAELLFGCPQLPNSITAYLGEIPMFIITNKQRLYGAGCILYPGILDMVAKKLGSDFYILPSSIHETIAVPAENYDKSHAETLKMMVMEINQSQLPYEEVLTDSVFYYSSSTNKLFLAV